ncbi:MAG: hydrogenase maturation factor [Lachnospiraceae bacterium]|nr:hydrogenase maturation factor [Lachnospiraceae bacterium]
MRNIGKISETVLKRSVLKPIKQYDRNNKSESAGVDCALFSDKGVALGYVAYEDEKACEHAIIQACNNLRAGAVIPGFITLSISMPDRFREIRLKEIMKQAVETAVSQNVRIISGHTEYVKDLKNPIISVNAFGDVTELSSTQKEAVNCDIVMTKWIALSGTSVIATQRKKELESRLPAYYVEDAIGLGQFISIAKEAEICAGSDSVIAMHDVAGGGIFTALWEICERIGAGCRVELDKLSVRQETIEVCEFFDINPYRLRGDGSLLIITTKGDELVQDLKNAGINATVIGKTTECIDRVVLRDEETRYLEPANGDEINKVL